MEKRLCFKPEIYTVHFVYSYAASLYVAFLSRLRREGQFVVFFSSRGARGHALITVTDPFSDPPFVW